MNRRDLLKTAGVATGVALVGTPAAAETPSGPREQHGVLIDTTRCVGCRLCERACADANDLPEPPASVDPDVARDTSPTAWTVVNGYDVGERRATVKRQCMHCLQPACVSACLTRAMHRTESGAIVWDADRCMGCRFCMVSCPFDMPTFEYDSPVPRIRKCELCWQRVGEGRQPACVEACPAKALVFGRRADLLHLARTRIYNNPERYVPHIYGEHEAGGTSVLYLASVPFDQIGFRTDLSTAPYPTFTREFLYAVPVVLTLLPPLLLVISKAKREDEVREHEQATKETTR